MLAHDRLNGLGGLVGMIEGDSGHIVVKDVGLNNAVHEMTADEAKFAVNGRGGTAGKGPCVGLVMRERRVGVLEERDGNYHLVSPEDRYEIC